MTSKERVRMTLAHQEPDRIPFDLGGTVTTGIHRETYANLLEYLGLGGREIAIAETLQQLAVIDEDVLQRMDTDFRPISANYPKRFLPEFKEEGKYSVFHDQFGIKWRSPLQGGMYYDVCGHPFAEFTTVKEVEDYPFPDPLEDERYEGVKERIEAEHARTGAALTLAGAYGGITEGAAWIRGMENFLADFALEDPICEAILDKFTEFKAQHWKKCLELFGDKIDVAIEADDLGTQQSLLFSPDKYRKIIKPRQKYLYDTIKKAAPHVKIFLHSCGNVVPLLPDLIEIGVDALNPVQVTARDMDTAFLKKEFGKDITFWGGGIDSVNILNHGTVQQVKDEVKRRIDDLAPGGGFIFAAVHNIQRDVPPQNIIAMREALAEFGVY